MARPISKKTGGKITSNTMVITLSKTDLQTRLIFCFAFFRNKILLLLSA